VSNSRAASSRASLGEKRKANGEQRSNRTPTILSQLSFYALGAVAQKVPSIVAQLDQAFSVLALGGAQRA
jgi:hypothetical protein